MKRKTLINIALSGLSAFTLALLLIACGDEKPIVNTVAPPDSLSLVYLYPSNGAESVSRAVKITAVFNQALASDGAMNNIKLYLAGENSEIPIQTTFDYKAETFEASIIPKESLSPNTKYRIEISKSLTGKNGSTLGADIASTFTTASVEPTSIFKVLDIRPPHGAFDQNPLVTIDVAFNLDVDPDQPLQELFLLRPATGTPISCKVSIDDTNTSSVISRPDKPLSPGMEYVIQILSQTASTSGTVLGVDIESRFSVANVAETTSEQTFDSGADEADSAE